jgi:branched-chain amino acid transport system substrate-binding protein
MARNGYLWALARSIFGTSGPASAQNEQFIPVLVYRTGAYAVSGVPYANGEVDYYNLINERDGGINGVKIAFEECETGYATDRGLECCEGRQADRVRRRTSTLPDRERLPTRPRCHTTMDAAG